MTTEILRVPNSVEEFLPPKPTDLITEAANFLRAHHDDVKPYLQMISGEIPSKHDSLLFDEAELAFWVQKKAQENGFAVLGTVKTKALWKALRRGYKRNTGTAIRQLEAQNKRLRIEFHKKDD
jgi:hypothetical protein